MFFFFASSGSEPPSMITSRDQMASVLAFGMPWVALAPFDDGTLTSEKSMRLLGHTFANAWAIVVPETSGMRGTVTTAVRLTGRVSTGAEYAGHTTIQPG